MLIYNTDTEGADLSTKLTCSNTEVSVWRGLTVLKFYSESILSRCDTHGGF